MKAKTFLLSICVTFALADNEFINTNDKVLYTSVSRGGIVEDLYTSEVAIKALQNGQNLPENTIITMYEYQKNNGTKGKLNRIIAMQKQGKEWKFMAFNADKTPNTKENTQRCLNCHKGLNKEDIVFTLEQIKAFKILKP